MPDRFLLLGCVLCDDAAHAVVTFSGIAGRLGSRVAAQGFVVITPCAGDLFEDNGADKMRGGWGGDSHHVDAAGDVIEKVDGRGHDTMMDAPRSEVRAILLEPVNGVRRLCNAGRLWGTAMALTC
ncbi:hypothetical protein [Thetidibacter halocola]|uniref:Uncharacterized protein n=1 Tax=Thetidibacter halocola TaxID=2827239 RepID=A0A8J7WFQ1_9RHOB|nr:hypothetical protein [Thetidibacter halocola]MBS0126800.1 hypothetical protein [Thetidibacter halocola]